MANSTNAMLSYQATNIDPRKNVPYELHLWVMKIAQAHSLSGSSHQSKNAKYFYPRAHAPGNMSITGRVRDEVALQQLAFFIRHHQRDLASTPLDQRFTRIDSNSGGYKRLMRLLIADEGIDIRGWIETFKIAKKGYKNVAPEYQFDFFVVFDNTSPDIGISSRVQKYYDLGLGQELIAKKKATTGTSPNVPDVNIPDVITDTSRPSLPGTQFNPFG